MARRAFAEVGTDLPMEELARRAGVGVGTVYRHFPNKETLLDAVLADHLSTLVARSRQALDEADPWEAFRAMVRDGAEMQAGDTALCDVMMERKAVSDSDAVAALRTELNAVTDELLGRAKAAGAMRTDFTIDDVPVLFASIAGAIRSSSSPEAWRRQVEFALDGLRAPSAA